MSRRFLRDEGAALITVLVMLAIMSALAIVAVDAAGMSIRRTANQTQMEQARWYVLGAEAFAAGKLAELTRRAQQGAVDQEEWQGRPFTFPLDEGGVMTVTLWDGDNCLNLNSLVQRDGQGALISDPRGHVYLARLFDLTDIRAESGLVPALIDWIDTDSFPGAGGAEDEAYDTVEAPYRAANGFIADVSELKQVRGYNDEIVARIAPFVCVRPTEETNIINPNTLRVEQAELLSMAIGPDLPLSAAREVIRTRPRGGWQDVDTFFSQSRLAGLEIAEPTRMQFSTTTRYFIVTTRVQYRDASESGAALIEMGSTPHVLRRVFGAGGSEHAL